jgi:hypothetical protein
VIDAEGEIVSSFRWKFEGEEGWRGGDIVARHEYEAQRMYLLNLLDGNWPAGRLLGIDRTNLHKKIQAYGLDKEQGDSERKDS